MQAKVLYYVYLILSPFVFIALKLLADWSKIYSSQTFTPVSTIIAIILLIFYGIFIGIDTLFITKLPKEQVVLPKVIGISILLITYLIGFISYHWSIETSILISLGYQCITLIHAVNKLKSQKANGD